MQGDASHRNFSRRGPITRVGNRTWFVSGYEEARAVLCSDAIHVDVGSPRSQENGCVTSPPVADRLLMMNGSDHKRNRRVVAPHLTAKSLSSLRESFVAKADVLVNKALSALGVEVISELALPFSTYAVCELAGVPEADREMVAQWAVWAAEGIDRTTRVLDQDRVISSDSQLRHYIETNLDSFASSDIVRGLLAARETHIISERELIGTCSMLLMGGVATTVSLLGHSVLMLASGAPTFEELKEDSSLNSAWIDDLVRLSSPVQTGVRRVVKAPIEIRDCQLEAGDEVIVLFGPANRDDRVFSNNDCVALGKRPIRHLGFGAGPHSCIGASLARMEVAIFVGAILNGVDRIDVIEEPTFVNSRAIRSISKLTVRLFAEQA
jgi:cytochrome P450